MDKMREEFEKINSIPAGVIRCGDSYAATDWGWVSHDYVKAFKAFVAGWKASRAVLCVQMPKTHTYDSDCERDALQALDYSGVRYE